ncbi:MAG: polysaccharide deacetylase family protein [Treponema sp.]|jgi:peptidoglycan/xylan/chitin deacetylase (PgdA/CDA1 family)|nr:polysaccharide deacetylase family protein [Treponema sp.]
MKRIVYGISMFMLGSLTACASRQPVLIPEIPPASIDPKTVPEVTPQVRVDPLPLRDEPSLPKLTEPSPGSIRTVPEKPSVLEAVVQRVKQYTPEIKKYIFQEGDTILVKSDIGPEDLPEVDALDHPPDTRFEVVYDLQHAQQLDDARFWVDFSVQEQSTGSVQQDRLLWHIQEDAAGLLLAFDDNYQDAWERNLEVFDQYGAKVTFFIQGDLCPFCFTALSKGHDVGYHTQHHLNLTQVSRETFFVETLAALDIFRNAGIPLRSFAYPYGLSEPWMHEELSQSFKILRGYGVTFRVYDEETIRKGYISSKALDNILYKQDADFEAVITIMLRTLKFIGGEQILPLTTHDISDTADWGIKPHRLKYMLQTAKDLHLRFYRYQDF